MRLGRGTTIPFSLMAGAVFIAGAVELLTTDSAIAGMQPPCDFVTGGGFIVRNSGDKANFGIAGSCKNNFSWGHLEYVDHSQRLKVKGTGITAYLGPGCSPTGPSDAHTRCICGTAKSDAFGDVEFGVVVDDMGEPGTNDVFKIRLTQGGKTVYTTESDSDHTLGATGHCGGNIQLHKPNPYSTFGGSCPAFRPPPACIPAGTTGCLTDADCCQQPAATVCNTSQGGLCQTPG